MKYLKLFSILALVLTIQCFSGKAFSQEPSVRFTTVYNGGYTLNLNSRMDEGVSTSGFSMGIREEVRIIFKKWALRGSAYTELSIFPGFAWTWFTGLMGQYERPVKFLNRSWILGAGYGFAWGLVPTRDADIKFYNSTVKLDLRTFISKNYFAGLYLRYDQIHMTDVKDPMFFSVGLEFGKSENPYSDMILPEDVAKVATPAKKTPEVKKPVVTGTPDDLDGDGVKNDRDTCPSSLKGREVDETGCRTISDGMVFEKLSFEKGSAKLTADGELEVKRIVEILKAKTSINIVIIVRSADKNLATKKADTIELRLRQAGIDSKRIKTDAQAGAEEKITFNFELKLQ
ncbi:hypothetical protein KKF97_17775 [Myxococcota bacterium]|nr:hypothetical protein [Myxococcota bacterium]MBU1381009.1 hypothetical protein [Myxococcota bacterium]MBU1502651.1 hypothetical protein [bacterium]